MRDTDDRLKIDFISSAGKLKGFGDKVHDTNTYKDHKRDGIAFCHQFMAANPLLASFRQIIEAAAKKDDLADCFLQGIYYLKRENIIMYSENLKINIV